MFSSSDTFRLMTTSRLLLIISRDVSDSFVPFYNHMPEVSHSHFQAGRKNISQALHLLCVPWEATLTQTLHSLRHAYNATLYSAGAVLSPQQDMLRDSRQPIYSVLLGWGLKTIPNKPESNRKFICSSQQHLNIKCGSEWWIKHVLYQTFFFIPMGDSQNN